MDLSNEVLNIDFGQGAAEISEVKVGGQKKYLPTRRIRDRCAHTQGRTGRFFFQPPLTFDISAAP